MYGYVKQSISENIPKPLGKLIQLAHYVDANVFNETLTGRSVTVCLNFINATSIDWYSKKQATMEAATYISEFLADRTFVEQIIDLRTTLRYSGFHVNEKSYMFGDNEAVVNYSSNVHSKLHKRHNLLSFHRVRETVASKYINFNYLPSYEIPADMLSKHWGYQQVRDLLLLLLQHLTV